MSTISLATAARVDEESPKGICDESPRMVMNTRGSLKTRNNFILSQVQESWIEDGLWLLEFLCVPLRSEGHCGL